MHIVSEGERMAFTMTRSRNSNGNGESHVVAPRGGGGPSHRRRHHKFGTLFGSDRFGMLFAFCLIWMRTPPCCCPVREVGCGLLGSSSPLFPNPFNLELLLLLQYTLKVIKNENFTLHSEDK